MTRRKTVLTDIDVPRSTDPSHEKGSTLLFCVKSACPFCADFSDRRSRMSYQQIYSELGAFFYIAVLEIVVWVLILTSVIIESLQWNLEAMVKRRSFLNRTSCYRGVCHPAHIFL